MWECASVFEEPGPSPAVLVAAATRRLRGARWRRARLIQVYAGVVLAALVALACLLAYEAGQDSHAKTSITTLTGVASTNVTHQTVVMAEGWTYNVPRGVAYIDSHGTEVDGRRPPCLRPGHEAPITFGMVPLGGNVGTRTVVWVRCGARAT
jgi:hypothetical protein